MYDFIYSSLLMRTVKNFHQIQKYMNFISSRKQNSEIYEIHHILPRSMFPEFEKLKNNQWNAIKLSPREHFIAHKILWRAFGGPMTTAFHFMSNTSHIGMKISSKEYERLKIEFKERMSFLSKKKIWIHKNTLSAFVQPSIAADYISDGWEPGRRPKTKNKLRWVHINKNIHKVLKPNEILQDYLDMGWKCGMYRTSGYANSKGTVHIHKDTLNKMIKLDELEQYISNGWIRGRNKNLFTTQTYKEKQQNFKKSTIHVNNGETHIRILITDQEKYLKCGWVVGKYIDEQHKAAHQIRMSNRTRISNGISEKFVKTEELEEYLKNGWRIGPKPLSPEMKKQKSDKISKCRKGKRLSEEHNRKNREARLGKIFVTCLITKTNVLIDPEEIDYYLKCGYIKGRYDRVIRS